MPETIRSTTFLFTLLTTPTLFQKITLTTEAPTQRLRKVIASESPNVYKLKITFLGNRGETRSNSAAPSGVPTVSKRVYEAQLSPSLLPPLRIRLSQLEVPHSNHQEPTPISCATASAWRYSSQRSCTEKCRVRVKAIRTKT